MPKIITEYINGVDNFVGYFKRTCLTNSGVVNSITEAIEKNVGVDRIYTVYGKYLLNVTFRENVDSI